MPTSGAIGRTVDRRLRMFTDRGRATGATGGPCKALAVPHL
jgi:hypothetical protein